MLELQIEWLKFITFIIWFLNAVIGGLLFVVALMAVWRSCAVSRECKTRD
jgi:hypothetical protein